MSTLNTPLNQVVLALVATGHIDRTDVKSKSEDDILLLAADVIDGTEPSHVVSGGSNAASKSNEKPILTGDEVGCVGVDEDGWLIYEHQYVWPSATLEKAHRLLKKVIELRKEVDSDDEDFDPSADFDEDDDGILPLHNYTESTLAQAMFNNLGLAMRPSLDINKVYDNASDDHSEDKLRAEVCDNYFAQDNASFAEFFAKHTFFIDYFYIEQIREIEKADSVAQLARRLYLNSSAQVSVNSLRNAGFKKEAVSSMKQTQCRQIAWALNLDDVQEKYCKEARRQLGY